MKNIGIAVNPPQGECNDQKCPFHGHLSVRGQIIEGVVKSNSMIGTAVISKDRRRKISKYERYETRVSKHHAHIPGCMSVKIGDKVRIAECRKLAKTVSFVVIEKVNQ